MEFSLIIFCNSVLLVSCFMELRLRYKLVVVCYWSMTADFITSYWQGLHSNSTPPSTETSVLKKELEMANIESLEKSLALCVTRITRSCHRCTGRPTNKFTIMGTWEDDVWCIVLSFILIILLKSENVGSVGTKLYRDVKYLLKYIFNYFQISCH